MAILPFSQDIALSLYNSTDSHPIDLSAFMVPQVL